MFVCQFCANARDLTFCIILSRGSIHVSPLSLFYAKVCRIASHHNMHLIEYLPPINVIHFLLPQQKLTNLNETSRLLTKYWLAPIIYILQRMLSNTSNIQFHPNARNQLAEQIHYDKKIFYYSHSLLMRKRSYLTFPHMILNN